MSIRDDFFAAQAKASLWDVAVSIKRGNPLPLDANSVFKAYGETGADNYAGSLLEYATSNPVAYPGQICAVVAENATTIYYLDQNLEIQPVGIIPTGDDKTIEVTADGAISLLGAAGAANGTLPMIDATTGKLVWKTLEDIGAGDGNDNTTYEFAFADQKITITPKFNGQPIVEDETQVTYELDLSTFVTNDELAEAIKDFVTTDTTYSVAEGEKILKLEGTEFSTVVSLKYVPAVEADAEAGTAAIPAKLQLLGIGDAVVAEIDATPFVRDGMLNDVDYNTDEKTITFYWNTAAGIQADTIALGDLVDTYTAGNGLTLANNQFAVKVDTASENFLTVSEAGVKLAGVAEAIAAAEGRAAADAQTKATQAKDDAIADAATKYYGKNEVYTKSETDSKIDEKIASVTGGESAADVKLALESYRNALNTEIWGPDAANWTVTTEEDGKTKVTYTPQYGNTSRVDTLETKVEALEKVGAQANVIEVVNGAADNRIAVTTSGKTVTIDDANLRTDIADAKKAGTDAASAANTNAQAITGHDTRIGALETAKTSQGEAITALQNADITINGKITDLENTVNNETTGVTATAAKVSKNTSDIAALQAQDGTHTQEIAGLKTLTAGHTTDIANINTALGNVYTKNDTYSKTEVDGTVATINEALGKKLESADLSAYAKTADVVVKTDYEADKTQINNSIAGNTTLINTLIGNDAGKSARAIAADEINTLIKAADPEGNKTIEQISDLVKYVDENAGDIAALVAQANASTAALAGIGGDHEPATVLEAIAEAAYKLPVATTTALGGVISAQDVQSGDTVTAAANSVYVDTTGLMTVKKVTTDILENGENELVLFGGKA